MCLCSMWCLRDSLSSWSPQKCGDKLELVSSLALVMSKEIVLMATLITDGVGKEKLRMVTIFICSEQAKVEPSVALLTLVQQYSHELAMVVMKIFNNSPYFLQGSFSLPFLDMCTLSEGASTIQFLLSWLCLCWLLLFSPNQVILSKKEAHANELKITPITMEALWESSIEKHHLSSLVPFICPSYILWHLQGWGLTDWWRTRLPCGSKAAEVPLG